MKKEKKSRQQKEKGAPEQEAQPSKVDEPVKDSPSIAAYDPNTVTLADQSNSSKANFFKRIPDILAKLKPKDKTPILNQTSVIMAPENQNNSSKANFFKSTIDKMTKLMPKNKTLRIDESTTKNKTVKPEHNLLSQIKIHKKEKKLKQRIFTLRGLIKAIDLQTTLEKAGYDNAEPKLIVRNIFRINIALFFAATIFLLVKGVIDGAKMLNLIGFILAGWIVAFFLSFGIIWGCYLFFLDMRIYQRKNEVEKVFPDFLQLASSNISAGMPIDRALWYAVRPNFGILAKEMEQVAKNTFTGEDLSDALQEFAKKYDSKVIQRSTSLLLEGLAAGGELSELLNKIALNIEETRILKRDMAANVTTYVIFITFASIVAAPALLGLSTQLLEIISKITSSISTQNPSSSTGFISFSFSNDSVSVNNFKIFSYVMLTVSSISAACIVNIIQTGKVKDGLMKIPVFVIVSCTIYLVSSALMSYVFSGII